jgi:hypothetical protein
MRSYYMRAKASDTGLVYNWHASSADFGAAGYPGTGVANDVLVESWYDDSSGGGGVSASLDWKDSVRAATTTALPASTRVGNVRTANANGALPSVDTISLAAGEALLDKDHATGADRGIWEVTSLGSAGAPWVLTRRTDCDASSDVTGGLRVPVVAGAANGGKVWKLDTVDPITLNTTALSFSIDSGAGTTAGDGLQGSSVLSVKPNGGTIDVSSSGVKVADGSIGALQLEDGSIETAKYDDGSITPAKLVGGKSITDIAGVTVATTGNVALSGTPANIDTGPSLINGVSRILVWLNTLAKENGVYLYNSAGAWSRVSDFTGGSDFRPGVRFKIGSGAKYGNRFAWFVGPTGPNVGTDDLVFDVDFGISQPAIKGQTPTWDGTKFVLRGLKTRATDLGDADTSVDVTEGSRFVIGQANTAIRSYTLLNTAPAADGWIVQFECLVALAFAVQIKNAAGAVILTLPAGLVTVGSCKFSGAWTGIGFTELV